MKKRDMFLKLFLLRLNIVSVSWILVQMLLVICMAETC